MANLNDTLAKFTNEYLIEVVLNLMDKLSKKERIEFISKYISAEIALEEVGYNNDTSFLDKVLSFCKECLNGDYYIEPEYHDYYDEGPYDNMHESVWVEKFTEYLKIATMYSRNKTYEVSFQSFDKLFDCLHEAECNVELLGTIDPTDYINLDWIEVFKEYFESMKNQVTNKEQLTDKSLDIWLSFGESCTEAILKNLDNIILIEKSIRKSIKDNDDWTIQHQLYELLKRFYINLSEEFNELDIASSMIIYNPNFLNDVAQAFINRKMWEEAVNVIEGALQKVETSPVVSALNTKLVDSYEKLGMNGDAFNVSLKMFYTNNNHDLYKRARLFAEKLGDINTFIDSMEKYMLSCKGYDSLETLIRILSFEGRTEKLIDTALKSDGYSRHDYLKYTSKSLIYQALDSEEISLPDLKEYIESIENHEIPGIVDMIKQSADFSKKRYLLNNAIEILKIMVQFHINVATRSRYQRAAYYCAIIKDIFSYLDKKNEFDEYYGKIIQGNNRRPALKDEMKKKIGYN